MNANVDSGGGLCVLTIISRVLNTVVDFWYLFVIEDSVVLSI